jgi:hypothetical protein
VIPDTETFVAGKLSFIAGLIENPYDPVEHFEAYREWQRGFDRAYFENLSYHKTQKLLRKR